MQHGGKDGEAVLCQQGLACRDKDTLPAMPCCNDQDAVAAGGITKGNGKNADDVPGWQHGEGGLLNTGLHKPFTALQRFRRALVSSLEAQGEPGHKDSSANGFPGTSEHKNLWPLSWLDVVGYLIAVVTLFIAAGAIS